MLLNLVPLLFTIRILPLIFVYSRCNPLSLLPWSLLSILALPGGSVCFFLALHQMTRQQEIGNALFDRVLMSTMPANQFSVGNTRFHQQCMQVL